MNEKYQKVAERLKGPLAIVVVPFTESEEVDHESLAKWVEWLGANHVQNMWITAGTSEMPSLTEDEIFRVTQTVAEANRGRIFFIASTGPTWPVSKCIEFIRFAKACGVDAVKLQTNWLSGPKPDDVFQFYGRVAEATDLPLLAYTLYQPGMSANLLTRITDAYPQFIGIKNDTDDMYLQSEYLCSAPAGFAAITGGMMRTILLGYPFGQRCYADSFANFKPSVALDFFSMLESGRIADAIEQIKKYELPWSDMFFGPHKLDCPTVTKTILWLTGHFATNRMRFPWTQYAVDGPQVAIIRDFLTTVGVEVQR